MAIIDSELHTLPEIAKSMDPMGKEKPIIDLLSKDRGLLEVMPFRAADTPTGHYITVTDGYPTIVWGQLNVGVKPTKGELVQITETMGHLESWLEIPQKIIALKAASSDNRVVRNARVRGYISAQSYMHQQAMKDQATTSFLYSNSLKDHKQILGLTPRFSSKAATNGQNILIGNANASGSKYTSIWLLGLGDGGIYGIYPPNTQAGLVHDRKGVVTSETVGGAGTRLDVYRESFLWWLGLAIEDWRCAIRIGDIDLAKLVSNATDKADLQTLTMRAENRIPSDKQHLKWCYVMNRSVIQEFEIQRRLDVLGAGMRYPDVDGKRFRSLRGFPILSTDAIVTNESAIAA